MLDNVYDDVVVEDFRTLERNSLRGFLKVRVPAVDMIFDGIALHEKDGRYWTQLPSRPMLDPSGEVVKDEDGKVKYMRMAWFNSRESADRFSAAVIAALGKLHSF
jgi:hypothetical protein